jgi:hypothetical protein
MYNRFAVIVILNAVSLDGFVMLSRAISYTNKNNLYYNFAPIKDDTKNNFDPKSKSVIFSSLF